jgi:LysR family transcriptional activator of glutamate synthase operon
MVLLLLVKIALMEFRQLRTLVVLQETGNITQVANTLHLSPAAIHKQLAALQLELGVRLYERVGRNLRMTQVCRMLAPYLREILAQYDATLGAVEEWKGLKRGLVSIGSGPSLSTCLLPLLVARFRRSFPRIEVAIETGNSQSLLHSVVDGNLDVALTVAAEAIEDVVTIASWDFQLLMVCSPRTAPRHCPISRLNRLPFILFGEGSRVGRLVDRYFTELDLRPNVSMRCDSAMTIRELVRAGMGVSMLPTYLVHADIENGSLSLVRSPGRPLFMKVTLIGRKTGLMSQATGAFVETAKSFTWPMPQSDGLNGQ